MQNLIWVEIWRKWGMHFAQSNCYSSYSFQLLTYFNFVMFLPFLTSLSPYLSALDFWHSLVWNIDIDELDFFSIFFWMFLNPNDFIPIWILIVLIYMIWETSRNKLKKHSVTKNCSDLSLFGQIVLVISKFLQILGLKPRISNLKFFFWTILFRFRLKV